MSIDLHSLAAGLIKNKELRTKKLSRADGAKPLEADDQEFVFPLDSEATPLSEQLSSQEGFVVDNSARDYNPVSGIAIQQSIAKSRRPKFAVNIQFKHSMTAITKLTLYTYPNSRLREYKPLNPAEETILEHCREDAGRSAGRLMTRGRKGVVIGDIQCFVEGDDIQTVHLILGDHTYTICVNEEPLYAQQQYYSRVGHWGESLKTKSNSRVVSVFDIAGETV